MSVSGSWVSTILVAYNIFKDCENMKISVILVENKVTITATSIEMSLLPALVIKRNVKF